MRAGRTNTAGLLAGPAKNNDASATPEAETHCQQIANTATIASMRIGRLALRISAWRIANQTIAGINTT
jgi:hypothetical protein